MEVGCDGVDKSWKEKLVGLVLGSSRQQQQQVRNKKWQSVVVACVCVCASASAKEGGTMEDGGWRALRSKQKQMELLSSWRGGWAGGSVVRKSNSSSGAGEARLIVGNGRARQEAKEPRGLIGWSLLHGGVRTTFFGE